MVIHDTAIVAFESLVNTEGFKTVIHDTSAFVAFESLVNTKNVKYYG